MARVLLAIDFEVEARLLEGIIAAGHDIVDRVSGGLAAATAIARLRPDAVVLQGAPETLTPRSLEACVRFGAQVVVLAASDLERRNAAALGIADVIDASASWSEIEVLLSARTRGDDAVATGPIPQQAQSFARLPAGTTDRVSATDVNDGSTVEARAEHLEQRASHGDGRTRRSLRGRSERSIQASRAIAARRSSGTPGATGRLLAVWGPHGAPGVSTIAAAVAASAATSGQRVLLIDADTFGGSLAPSLGITDEAPGFAAACRLAGSGHLTRSELERIAVARSLGHAQLMLLTGIANPARWPELSRDRVLTVLERCRDIADLVVVDVGFSIERDDEITGDAFSPRRSAATLAALSAADRILAVADGHAVGLQRFLRARLALVELVSDTPVDIVVNRVRADAVGFGAHGQIAHVLQRFAGVDASALVPLDQAACDRALLAGEPVTYASPRSPFSRAIAAYVTRTLALDHSADEPHEVETRGRTTSRSAIRRFWRGRGELQAQNS